MSFEWTDKKDGDIILADDSNTLAEGVKEALASIPTKTSQLENDSNYVNKTYVDNKTIYDITDGKISTQSGYLTLGDGTEFSKITIQGGRIEAGDGVQINNLQSPILDNDAVNKKYVDDKLLGYLPLSGGSVSGKLLFGPALELKSENTGSGYNKSTINAIGGGGDILELSTYYLNASGYKARINFDSNGILIDGYEGSGQVMIKDVSTPINNNDAVNKKYVDEKYTVLSQSEYNAITEKDPDKIYFIYEE